MASSVRFGVKGERQRRLDLMAKQIADGSLIIRQASSAEREPTAQQATTPWENGVPPHRAGGGVARCAAACSAV
jgi:hypothetical protein